MKKVMVGLALLFFVAMPSVCLGALDSRIDGLMDSRHWDGSDIASYALPPLVSGFNLYVDPVNGSDSYNGFYPAHTTGNNGPKKNIAGDNGAIGAYSYWDNIAPVHIMIRTGKMKAWIQPRANWGSSSYEKHIAIGPYGDGKVIIDNSDWNLLSTWSAHDANIYKTQLTSQPCNSSIKTIVINGVYKSYRAVSSLANITSFGQWYYDSATRWLYIHTSGIDPTGADFTVINNCMDSGEVINNDAPYVTFYGLEIRGGGGSSFSSGGHFTFDHCIFANNGKGFYTSGTQSNPTQGYNHFISNIIRGNVLHNWPRGNSGWCDSDGGWPNALGAMNIYTIYARNVTYDNGGEGSQEGDYAEVRDNIFVDNFSLNGAYVGDADYQSYHNNIAIISYFNPYDILGYPSPPCVNWEKTRRKLRGSFSGFASEYGCSTQIRGGHNKVFNNIAVGGRYGIDYVEQCGGFYMDSNEVYNNTIVPPYDNFYNQSVNHTYGFYLSDNANNSSKFKNNVIYATDPSSYVLNRGFSGTNEFDYNVYYHTTRSDAFQRWNDGYNKTWAQYLVLAGDEIHSLFQDPQLTKTNWADTTALTLSDFALQSTSPARGAGTNLGTDYNYDYNYASRTNWDAGALEYGGTPNLFSHTEDLYDGQICSVDGDCQSGNCCNNMCSINACGIIPSPTPTPTPDPAQPTPTPTPTPPPAGTELLTNPGFENGSTGWTTPWGGTISNSSVQAHGGTYSELTSGRSDFYQGPTQQIVDALIVNGQGNYTFSGWTRMFSGQGIGKVTVEIDDSTGRHWFLGPQVAINDTGWAQSTVTMNLTWTGNITNAYFYFETVGTNGNFYADDASLKVYVPPTNNDSNRTFNGIQNTRTRNLLQSIRTFLKIQ